MRGRQTPPQPQRCVRDQRAGIAWEPVRDAERQAHPGPQVKAPGDSPAGVGGWGGEGGNDLHPLQRRAGLGLSPRAPITNSVTSPGDSPEP